MWTVGIDAGGRCVLSFLTWQTVTLLLGCPHSGWRTRVLSVCFACFHAALLNLNLPSLSPCTCHCQVFLKVGEETGRTIN